MLHNIVKNIVFVILVSTVFPIISYIILLPAIIYFKLSWPVFVPILLMLTAAMTWLWHRIMDKEKDDNG